MHIQKPYSTLSSSDDFISEAEIKSFMKLVVEQARTHPIIYKYLTFESGCQMLRYHNIQFTRGDKLNDNEDLNISKFNTNSPRKLCEDIGADMKLINDKFQEQSKVLASFGVCSLGTSPHNSVLWSRYSCGRQGQEDGICIGLNQEKVINALIKMGLKTACIVVRYKQSTLGTIPWLAKGTSNPVKTFAAYQFFALKNSNPWESEQEIRLVYPTQMDDEYKRIVLPKDCFETVYYGKDMTLSQKQTIGHIVSANISKIKRIPLTHTIPSF